MDQEPEYLKVLNEEQRKAVLYQGRSLLILAGAGSGKTRVITTRITYLVDRLGVDPRSILAVTFTNKAAREMSDRVGALCPQARDVTIRTFHSFGAWMLRRNGSLAGIAPGFAIYDDDDMVSLIRSVRPGIKRSEAAKMARVISRAKDSCLGPDDDISSFSMDPDLPEVYRDYESRLREIGNADFGDLILLCRNMLRDNSDFKHRIQRRFRIILVDEYQDSNVAQFELLRELVGEETQVCVVGDDDQSIYGFRGAEVKNILSFPEVFPGTEVIRLEQNYRSTGKILAAASAVVDNNSQRLGKTLWTQNGDGSKINISYLRDHMAESEYVADLVRKIGSRGTAILYRTNAQSMAFETLFSRLGISYQIVGALRFFEREEVKDALALLSVVMNPSDEVGFRRIVNKPARGIGKVSQDKIAVLARQEGVSLVEAGRIWASGSSSRGAKAMVILAEMLDQAREMVASKNPGEVVEYLLKESGLLAHYQKQDEANITQKEANLLQVVNAASEYEAGLEGVGAFLEEVSLDRTSLAGENSEPDPDAVILITMHNTKGLEFDRVIITGMEDGLFPSRREDDSDEELEEERRIFYVALTRARKELYLTCCRRRLIWGRWIDFKPSAFLDEIPGDLVNEEGRSPAVNSRGGKYRPGVWVYHDDYGTGVVVKTDQKSGSEMVYVRFESGRNAQFFAEYANFEIVESPGC